MTATDEQTTAMTRAFNNASDRLPTMWSADVSPWAKRPDLSTDEIVARYQRGDSTRCIARALSCAQRTVVTRLNEAGVTLRHDVRPRTSYGSFHVYVRKIRGTPTECEDCGTTDPAARYEWASLTRNYADPFDYKRLCKPCHARFDEIAEKARAFLTGRARPELRGIKHPLAKLSEGDVVAIRQRHAEGTSAYSLGTEFGVSDVQITRIVRRQSWGHLP